VPHIASRPTGHVFFFFRYWGDEGESSTRHLFLYFKRTDDVGGKEITQNIYIEICTSVRSIQF